MDEYDMDNVPRTPKTTTSRASPSGPTPGRPTSWTPSLSFLNEDESPAVREEPYEPVLKSGVVPGGLEFL
eukprot:7996779-Pyramimonas_sp.AAC.1